MKVARPLLWECQAALESLVFESFCLSHPLRAWLDLWCVSASGCQMCYSGVPKHEASDKIEHIHASSVVFVHLKINGISHKKCVMCARVVQETFNLSDQTSLLSVFSVTRYNSIHVCVKFYDPFASNRNDTV